MFQMAGFYEHCIIQQIVIYDIFWQIIDKMNFESNTSLAFFFLR